MTKLRIFPLLIFLLAIASLTKAQQPLYPTLSAGTIAPELKGKNEKGKSCTLSKMKSRLTLLYFYEVHCHLCESIIPDLKKIYEAYHKTGLEIVAIPINSEKEDWKKYISDNQLPWKHLYPGNEAESVKSNYRLEVSPTFYLLNKKHILLTERMGRIEQVEESLNVFIR